MHPSQATPKVIDKFGTQNDQQSVVKMRNNDFPFALNFNPEGNDLGRRAGRDFSFISSDGAVYAIKQIEFSDGTSSTVAQFGAFVYALEVGFQYILNSGVRIIIQSADLNYWNVTPNSNDLIAPTVVSAPAATAQAANITIPYGQKLGFASATGTVQLGADQNRPGGWFLLKFGSSVPTTAITTDWVFTVASGFSLRIIDGNANTWSFKVSNAGALQVITV